MIKAIAAGTLLLILALINVEIYKKERQLADGQQVFLPLAPVDPRSLMQGDYMALRFQMAQDIEAALSGHDNDENRARWRETRVTGEDGHVIVTLDANAVAQFSGLDQGQPLADHQLRLHYRIRNGNVKFATNAFFFQEGSASFYDDAKYGAFRVDDKGELLLTDLHDEQLQRLGPSARPDHQDIP